MKTISNASTIMPAVNLFILYCTLISLPHVLGYKDNLEIAKNVTLGGLFERNDSSLYAFVAAVETINDWRHIDKHLKNKIFTANIYEINNDLYDTKNKVCNLLRNKVIAIFGPSEKNSAELVQSICDNVEVPNIVARWDIEPTKMKAFNFFPQADLLAKVFNRIITHFEWKSFTILYDSSDSLVHTNDLLKKWNPKGYTVAIRHLDRSTDFRKILLDVKKTKVENIVIDCSYEILDTVLRQAQQVGLMSDHHNILVTNLDMHTIDLDPYRYSGVNLTSIRLIDVETSDPHGKYGTFFKKLGIDRIDQLRVQSALMFDAVKFFSRALRRSLHGKNDYVRALNCNGSDYWDFGTILGNNLRTIESRGLTGLIKLNSYGFREDFELDIVSLRRDGLEKIGVFNSTQSFEISWTENKIFDTLAEKAQLYNKTFRVLIALVSPYNMLKKSASTRTGNDRYEGFAIDIIQEISNLLHFNYTFIVSDPDYGKMIDNATEKWSGMIGKLMQGEADLAITDLTITAERQRVVDFTTPFMNLGISILYRKPTKAAPSLFSFLSPFAGDVWIYLIISYTFCSLLLFLIGRMSPKEWTNPYPCIEEPEILHNQFTLKNSLWFMIGAIMQQGSEIAPIGLSTRMLASAWWFFCLIIVSSYTANLAAFLVVETNVKIIKSAKDLANLNGKISYGAKANGATFEFFKTSAESQLNTYSEYAKMYKYMIDNKQEVMTESNEAGIEKVRDITQNYAFLMESSSIEYIIQRECNLTQIGSMLDEKGYGIAMPKNASYRASINDAVLQLQESGTLANLKTKWWEQKRGGGKCKNDPPAEASKLTLDHVGGVFVVLGCGVAMSVPFAFWEFIWYIVTIAYKENLSFKKVFRDEMKSIVRAKSSVKPARKQNCFSGMNSRGSTPGEYSFGPNVIMTPPDMN